MITGAAKAIADQLGISRWKAEVLPADKAAEVDTLQREGRRVGVAGDGVNDAPALAKADVGFALASGSGASLDVADVTLMKNDLAGIADAIELSRATLSRSGRICFSLSFTISWAFRSPPRVCSTR